MTALDLDRLEALADAATPGPWVSSGERGRHTADVLTLDPQGSEGDRLVICEHAGPDAVFIAETGPDVIKELVRQLREARAEIGGSRSIVAHLLSELGGSATFSAFELAEADLDGTITRTDDPATRTITLTYRRNDE